MIIEHKHSSIFESDAACWVNTVNCVGVMGKGLALEFKNRFPDNFIEYRDWCESGNAMPGKVLPVTNGFCPSWIFNVATKNHWNSPSRIEWVETGIKRIAVLIARYGIKSAAVPAIGCGEGGLQWNRVRPLLLQAFADIPARVEIYPPAESV